MASEEAPVAICEGTPAYDAVKAAVAIKLSSMFPDFKADDPENVLPEYVQVMLSNKKTKAQITSELQPFLESHTPGFVDWLWEYLSQVEAGEECMKEDASSYGESDAESISSSSAHSVSSGSGDEGKGEGPSTIQSRVSQGTSWNPTPSSRIQREKRKRTSDDTGYASAKLLGRAIRQASQSVARPEPMEPAKPPYRASNRKSSRSEKRCSKSVARSRSHRGRSEGRTKRHLSRDRDEERVERRLRREKRHREREARRLAKMDKQEKKLRERVLVAQRVVSMDMSQPTLHHSMQAYPNPSSLMPNQPFPSHQMHSAVYSNPNMTPAMLGNPNMNPATHGHQAMNPAFFMNSGYGTATPQPFNPQMQTKPLLFHSNPTQQHQLRSRLEQELQLRLLQRQGQPGMPSFGLQNPQVGLGMTPAQRIPAGLTKQSIPPCFNQSGINSMCSQLTPIPWPLCHSNRTILLSVEDNMSNFSVAMPEVRAFWNILRNELKQSRRTPEHLLHMLAYPRHISAQSWQGSGGLSSFMTHC